MKTKKTQTFIPYDESSGISKDVWDAIEGRKVLSKNTKNSINWQSYLKSRISPLTKQNNLVK